MTMPAPASTLSATFQRSRDLARRAGVAGFWQWWGRELWSWIPAPVQASLARRRARPVLAFDGTAATLWHRAAGGALRMLEATRIPLDGDPVSVDANGRAALAPLARGGAAPRVVVALPDGAALRKPLTLPEAVDENLRQALAYDLDRHTPFRSSDLYFDAIVVDRDPSHRTIRVELVAARKSVVDPLLARAEAFGAEVAAVTVDPPERAAWTKIDLLPDERRAERHRWSRWQAVIPAILLVALVLAALVVPVWQKRGEVIALNRVTQDALHRAEATDALRTELEHRVGEYNFPLSRKFAFPSAVALVNDVTRILPDDTWLTQLEYRATPGKDSAHTIVLRGESANAGKLVALLQDSKLFTQAAPRSPTTKIQPGPGEIFDIGAQVEPLAAPKPAAIDLSAPPPRPAPPRPALVPRPAVPQPTAPQSATPRPAAPQSAVRPRAATPPGAPATPARAAEDTEAAPAAQAAPLQEDDGSGSTPGASPAAPGPSAGTADSQSREAERRP